MRLRALFNHLIGKSKAKNPARVTWRNIRAVLQAFFRQKRRKLGGFDLDDHIYEQIIYRRIQVLAKSPRCWITGNCIQCGCDILGKTMEDRACENSPYCYSEMMSKEDWDNYKKINGIKLFN